MGGGDRWIGGVEAEAGEAFPYVRKFETGMDLRIEPRVGSHLTTDRIQIMTAMGTVIEYAE